MEAEWIGLIGASVGAAIGGTLAAVNSWLGDRRRNARDERNRWHQQRLEAYTTTWVRLSTVHEVFQASAQRAKRKFQGPWAPYKLMRELSSAGEALREAGEALTVLRFVASASVVATADQCMDLLAGLMAAYADQSTPQDRLDELVEQMNSARHDLVEKARVELGVEPISGRPTLGGEVDR